MTSPSVEATHAAPASLGAFPHQLAVVKWQEEWRAYAARQLKPRVLRGYDHVIQMFVDFLGPKPIADSGESDIWAFIDRELAACGNLRSFNVKSVGGVFCKAGVFGQRKEPTSSCNVTCGKYQGRSPLVIHHDLKALSSFYRFLVRRGHTSSNFVPYVSKDFSKEFPAEAHMTPRRKPTLTEVQKLLVNTVHPTRRALYLLLAKTGFRIHEACMLTTEPTCIDLEQRIIRIPVPASRHAPNKRRGKRIGIVDDELRGELETYLAYRAGLLARRAADRQPTEFFVGDTGRPLKANLANAWLHEDCARTGLVANSKDASNKITAHSFRHFFTTVLFQRRCPERYIDHLRGDKIRKITGVYYDPDEQELKDAYLEFFPTIGG